MSFLTQNITAVRKFKADFDTCAKSSDFVSGMVARPVRVKFDGMVKEVYVALYIKSWKTVVIDLAENRFCIGLDLYKSLGLHVLSAYHKVPLGVDKSLVDFIENYDIKNFTFSFNNDSSDSSEGKNMAIFFNGNIRYAPLIGFSHPFGERYLCFYLKHCFFWEDSFTSLKRLTSYMSDGDAIKHFFDNVTIDLSHIKCKAPIFHKDIPFHIRLEE